MRSDTNTVRPLAYYLPQFHPIAENDEWWERDFTEWTNVQRARPLYRGHRQPVKPGALGYYDLRDPGVREEQAQLAREHGIEGFCYWHYWFGGRRLLERPFNEVLDSGRPEYPFCLAWANHDWTSAWVGRGWEVLVKQTYDDLESHFEWLRRPFDDPRYIRVDGKPVFVVFRPERMPEPRAFAELFRELAARAGYPGLYLIGQANPGAKAEPWGFDAVSAKGTNNLRAQLSPARSAGEELRARVLSRLNRHRLSGFQQALGKVRFKGDASSLGSWLSDRLQMPLRLDYVEAVRALVANEPDYGELPCVVPCWDNTPRIGRWGTVFENVTPEAFEEHVAHAVSLVLGRPPEERFIFIKSWNEWAEGNYLEPDAENGLAFLEAFRRGLARV
jgi:lipopolysaccharide biosynthesis protein